MELLQTFLWAMLMSILGFLPPGMMNMTTVKVTLEQSRKNAFKFMSGTLVIIAVQATIAIAFSKYLANNQYIINLLSYVGVVVFMVLSFVFYKQASSQKVIGGIASGTFISGVKMAAMNMLAIPFFLGYSTAMESTGFIQNKMPDNVFFVLGAVAGCFILFSIYMLMAEFVQKRAAFVAKNINYILSVLFLILAVITLYKIVWA